METPFITIPENEAARSASVASSAPRKSVVQVRFPDDGRSLAYYNDKFDLQPGDIVFVSGKLAGVRGRVLSVSYNFKIRLSDYQRVIAKADTEVHGDFFSSASHCITFNSLSLPPEKVRTWYFAPISEEEEFASGEDDASFRLENLDCDRFTPQIKLRGQEYYADDRVSYISLDDTRGYAIVEGTEPYEVEFEFRDGLISHLVCSCFCSYPCKHEYAVMLQLQEILDFLFEHYSDVYPEVNYFAAIDKHVLLSLAFSDKENRWITL